MTLQEAATNIGRKVIYTPKGNYTSKKLEEGVITSVGKYVFVRYGADCGSKATDAEDLELI